MARIDKYQPVAGGFRAPLNAAYTGAAAPIGVGLNSSGRVVVGAGQTGIVGVICSPYDKAAGDVIDCMTAGELVEFGGAAGTTYYAHATTGVISTTVSAYPVGSTVEADRLVVRVAQTASNDVVGDLAAVADVATADADATYGAPEASLINELKTQVNAILARLRSAGIIVP